MLNVALLLTKWVHTVEIADPLAQPNADEREILDRLKALLAETDSEYDATRSLAATVAHVSSAFLNDVWVWGVTPKMGNILQELAFAFDDAVQRARPST